MAKAFIEKRYPNWFDVWCFIMPNEAPELIESFKNEEEANQMVERLKQDR